MSASVKTFQGRPCLSGTCSGSAEVCHIGLNTCATWSGVMLQGKQTGVCSDHDNKELYGHDLAGKILCLPQTVGSSSAATAFLAILKYGVAPKAILFANHIDSLAACGLLMADIWKEQRCITVDNLGDDFLSTVQHGDTVDVSPDGMVTVTPKSASGGTVTTKPLAKADGSDQVRSSLGGHEGADAIYTLTTQTGSVDTKSHVAKGKEPTAMKLTQEEQDIVDGKQGDVASKGLRTIIRFGELFGAKELVELQGAPHMAMSWGSNVVLPLLEIYTILADAGLKTYAPFTADPKPVDYDNMDMSDEETKALKDLYCQMDRLEEVNLRLGMVKGGWSCACYLPQMGNRPKFGDNLAWSESSAISYTNSAIGARTNRNSYVCFFALHFLIFRAGPSIL